MAVNNNDKKQNNMFLNSYKNISKNYYFYKLVIILREDSVSKSTPTIRHCGWSGDWRL